MFRSFMMRTPVLQDPVPTEGELYKVLHIEGHSFPLYYGYYEKCDRDNPAVEPMPIYPDFLKEPRYTSGGFPFVTQMQDACRFFVGRAGPCGDCADCRHFAHGAELIGICTCLDNKRTHPGTGPAQMPVDGSSA